MKLFLNNSTTLDIEPDVLMSRELANWYDGLIDVQHYILRRLQRKAAGPNPGEPTKETPTQRTWWYKLTPGESPGLEEISAEEAEAQFHASPTPGEDEQSEGGER